VKEHDKSASERARLEEHAKQFLDDWPDTTQLVITGLHEEIERMRRKMTAIQEIARAHHPGGLPATETKRVLDLAFFEDWERDNAARDMAPAFTGSVPDFEQHLRKLDDADLWRAKAVQLAAALEEACGIAAYEDTANATTSAEEDAVFARIDELRALLDGDLAEPLAKLKRLREAVEEAERGPRQVVGDRSTPLGQHVGRIDALLGAAREVVR
jgi:hypothetical protein